MSETNTLPHLLQIDPHREESYNSDFRLLRYRSVATRSPQDVPTLSVISGF